MKRVAWFCVWVLVIAWLMFEAAALWPKTGRYEMWVHEDKQYILDTSTGAVWPVRTPPPPTNPGGCAQPCAEMPKDF